jgi:hypothetical protein
MESSCELGNETSVSIEFWQTTEWMHNVWRLEWYSAPQSSFFAVCVILCVGSGLGNSSSQSEYSRACKVSKAISVTGRGGL